MDEALDNLVGKAESVYENASDIIANAKEKLGAEDAHESCSHDHSADNNEETKTH